MAPALSISTSLILFDQLKRSASNGSIFTVPIGSPMIFRGSHWERQNNQGLLHRSPPIEGSGETRFVVVIDPIYEN